MVVDDLLGVFGVVWKNLGSEKVNRNEKRILITKKDKKSLKRGDSLLSKSEIEIV